MSHVKFKPSLVLPKRFFYEGLEASVSEVIEQDLEELRKCGATIVNGNIDGIEYAPGIHAITIASEATQANETILANNANALGSDVRLRLEAGQIFLASDYLKAQRLRSKVKRAVINSMGADGVLWVPAMPVLPPENGINVATIDGKQVHIGSMLMRFTSPFNFCGLPALSMPCGKSKSGLPVNIQIVGRPGADLQVLRVARLCEEQLGGK